LGSLVKPFDQTFKSAEKMFNQKFITPEYNESDIITVAPPDNTQAEAVVSVGNKRQSM